MTAGERAVAAAAARRARAVQVAASRPPAAAVLIPATVTRVDATNGASEDGAPVCYVTYDVDGAEVPAPYPQAYTPTVGDQVELMVQRGEPRIAWRLRGIPVAPPVVVDDGPDDDYLPPPDGDS